MSMAAPKSPSSSALGSAQQADTMLALESFLPYRLVVLAQAISQGLARIYSQRFGVVMPEWRVLAVLGQHKSLTAKDIGMRACMHKTKVSRTLAGMGRRGLVRRVPNPKDRREAFVTLTNTGASLYNAIVPLARNYAQELTANLAQSDRETMEHVLLALSAKVGPISADEISA
jgi:DNA-binding MarR family transcriptional regulator